MKPDDERWTDLAPRLAAERRESSFMALLLDHEVVARAVESSGPGSRVLDYGAGDGRLAMAVARGGATVDALEPTPGQFVELLVTADEAGPSVRALDAAEALRGPYDVALCVNVLDHIEDWTATISTIVHLVSPGGRVLVVVPHPLKDLGDWRRRPAAPPGGVPRRVLPRLRSRRLSVAGAVHEESGGPGRKRDRPCHPVVPPHGVHVLQRTS